MATKEALRKLREKYHLGEYKNKRSVRMARKTRRAFRAARKSVRSFRRSSVKPLNLKTIALMGAGAGVGSAASVFVRTHVPQLNSLPAVAGLDLVELGIGYVAYKYGHKLPMGGKFLSPIGAGMMIDSVGGLVKTVATPVLGGAASSGSVALY